MYFSYFQTDIERYIHNHHPQKMILADHKKLAVLHSDWILGKPGSKKM
jgi:hypothetical protein